jgi:PAS domain S-box
MLREIAALEKISVPLVDNEIHLDVPIGIFQSSVEGKLYQANKKMADILGYESPEELIFTVNKSNLEQFYVDKENHLKFAEEAVNDDLWHSYENKFYRKDGDVIVTELSLRAVKDCDGSVKYLKCFIKDITSFSNIKNELKEIGQNYRAIFDSSPNYVMIVESDCKILHVNKAGCEILGLSEGDLIGKHVLELDFLLDEEMPLCSKNIFQVLKGNKTKIPELRFIDKNREIRYIESFLTPLKKNSEVTGFTAISHDITESKKAEKRLKQSEQHYKTIFENTGTATFIFGEDTIISLANAECERLSGYSREELEGKSWIDFVAGEDREKLINYYHLRKKDPDSAPKNYEFKFINKHGNILHFYANIASIPGTNNRLASLLDITENKKFIESLKESENRYRKLLENSFDAVVIYDGNKIISANNAAMEILGIEKLNEFLDRSPLDFIQPKYHKVGTTIIREILEKNVVVPPTEHKLLRADGTLVDVEILAVGFIHEGKKALQAVFRDISPYKIAEEQKSELISELREFTKYLEITNKKLESTTQELQQKGAKLNFTNKILKEREEQLKLFIEHVPAAIAMFDNDMNYISTSKHWIKDYHLEGKEIIGRSHYEVSKIPDKLKMVHKRCLTGDSERCEEDMLVRADGTIIWVKWEVIPWYSSSGSIGGIMIFSEDITESKIAENDLKKSLEEKEILLKEIHHRVKNNLQIISSLLALQTNYVDNDKTKNVLYESQNRIKSMAIVHEMLYQSNDLATINFSNYIESLVNDLFYSYGAKDNIELIIDFEQVLLNIETAIPCGLIISELVSNSLKYAFPNNIPGKLMVTLYSNDNEFELIISDNGAGLPERIDFKNIESSLGLQLVNMLVKQLDGSIKLDKIKGTKFIIKFKELKYKKRL